MLDSTAEQLHNREGRGSEFKCNGYGYFGYYQIGYAAWTQVGGSLKEAPPTRTTKNGTQFIPNSTGLASKEYQRQVADKYWDWCAKQVGTDPNTGDMSLIYCAWNIGAGTVKKCIANPSAGIGASGTMKYIRTQAWGQHLAPEVTNSQALKLCKEYWDKGKTSGYVSPANPKTGTPESIQPAVIATDGGKSSGGFGGILKLWLKKNSFDPKDFAWTTVENENISNWFAVPSTLGLAGDDQFISKWGDGGPLTTDSNTGMPLAQCGDITGYFSPLNIGKL